MLKPTRLLRTLLLPLGLALAVQPLAAQSDLNVPSGGSVTVNESASFQNVTVPIGASLETVSGNSGGAGNHSISITLAASGAGTIQNDGMIAFTGTDQTNTTIFANPVTISGSGTLQFRNDTRFNTASVQGPGTVTQASGHTLVGTSGGGTDDTGPSFNAPLVNAGLVTTSYRGLHLDGASLRNTGTFSATGGATLTLGATTLDNTGGLVTAADAGSFVNLAGTTVIGGTLSSVNSTGSDTGGGIIYDSAPATLQNVTLAAGSVFRVDNPLTLAGTFTNNGYVFVGGYNFNTLVYSNLNVAADATLAGSGVARLGGGEIDAANNATLTVAAGATLLGGSGTINASVVNNGTVGSVYQTLTINSPTFTNNGVLAANNNANVTVSGGTNFTNSNAGTQTLTGGTYSVTDTGNGATLDFGGRNVLVNKATVTLNGANARFDALNGLTTNEGTLSLLALKQFTTSSGLTNPGTIVLDAGTTLHVSGNFTADSAATLSVAIGGTSTQGTQSPGVLQVGGTAAVGGILALSFPPGTALPGGGDSLVIVSAGSPISGSFANAANGSWLTTSDGQGSFLVSYGPDSAAPTQVVLSRFLLPGQAAPELPSVSFVVPGSDNGKSLVTAESGPKLKLLLTRTGDTSQPLTVTYKAASSAVAGVDYKELTGIATIPAGAASTKIKIKTFDDGVVDGTKVLKLKLTGSGATYTPGAVPKAKITILDVQGMQ